MKQNHNLFVVCKVFLPKSYRSMARKKLILIFSKQFETFPLLKYQFNSLRFLQDDQRLILGCVFIHFFNHSVNKQTMFMSRQGWACLWRKWLYLYQCLCYEMRVSTFIHSFATVFSWKLKQKNALFFTTNITFFQRSGSGPRPDVLL